MNQKNTVSILIPVYNSAKFLKESLESVLNQSYPYIEIIAINDGSTDNSLEILQQYNDRIIVINQDNSGLASTLNTGIKHATGKWIKWFSPDDVMYENAVETLVNHIKTHDNAIIYSDWDVIDESGKLLRSFHEYNYNKLSQFEYSIRLLDGQQINVNTALIPDTLFDNDFLFQDLDDPVAIDYDFFLRCALLHKTRFYLVPQTTIGYRMHKSQLSHKNIAKSLDYLETIKQKTLSQLTTESKRQYLDELHSYQKNKPALSKIKDYGLKIVKNLPTRISDSLIIFYLHKIRRTR